MSETKNERTMSDEFVTIGTFQDPIDANMAQTALESAGIESFMQGGNANSMIPVAFMARLQVRPEDESEARAILEGADESPESLASVTAAEIADEREKL
jgi:hypothetical protein